MHILFVCDRASSYNGKSRLLDAINKTRIANRKPTIGCLKAHNSAVSFILNSNIGYATMEEWKKIEQTTGKTMIVIIDSSAEAIADEKTMTITMYVNDVKVFDMGPSGLGLSRKLSICNIAANTLNGEID